MMRFVITVVTIGLIATAAWWLNGQSQPKVRPAKTASHADGPQLIYAPGVVEGASEQVELRLELSGRIEEVLVKEGEFVEPLTPLVRLDDATYRHEIDLLKAELQLVQAELLRLRNGAHQHERLEAQAILAAREARLKHAQIELDRSTRLLGTKAIGEQEAAKWEAEVKALTAEVRAAQARSDFVESPAREDEIAAFEAKLRAAEAKLALANTQLSRTLLIARSAGQILEVNHEPGELIDLDNPLPTLVMADTRRLRVRAYVEELDALAVRPNMTARITADGLPGRVFTGKVLQVLPRMSFKQVWTDQPDERFSVKSREVLIELDEPATSPVADDDVAPVGEIELVFGLVVEVEIDPLMAQPMLVREARGAER